MEVETRKTVYPDPELILGEPTLGTEDLKVSCSNGFVPFSGPLKTLFLGSMNLSRVLRGDQQEAVV